MRLSEYHIENDKIQRSLKLALISDLHGCDPREAISLMMRADPNYILAPGDIFEPVDGSHEKPNSKGFLLLEASANIAPTFYSMGNHEIGGTHSWARRLKIKSSEPVYWNEEGLERLKRSGVCFLDNSYFVRDGICFGGLSSGLLNDGARPYLGWLDCFCAENHPKILLCHHPEYYERYISDLDIDIVVSGHAHGGQWSFFGRGVFAPGQGLFPKYTAGVYDGRFIVSRGMKKAGIIPRFFNPTEVVIISVN